VAKAGDRILIQPGTYYDCSVWAADWLVIEGSGNDTILTDTICQDKAILITRGRGITIQDLVLSRARSRDGNGAGIRAESPDLRISRVTFTDNQVGLLAGDLHTGEMRIEECAFVRNGSSDATRSTPSLVVGSWSKLIIQRSQFKRVLGQFAVLSRSAMTEIDDSEISAPERAEGAAIQISGGLRIERSILDLTPGPSSGRPAIIVLPSSHPDTSITLRQNTLQGTGTLLLNWSGLASIAEENLLTAGSTLESTSGTWSYRIRSSIRDALQTARAVSQAFKRHLVERLLR